MKIDRRHCTRHEAFGVLSVTVTVLWMCLCHAWRMCCYTVHVGYEYRDCEVVFWQTQSTTIAAYDMPSSYIGAWNFDIHHTYNFQQGPSVRRAGLTLISVNNNNIQDNVYGAVVMAEPMREFTRFI